MVYLKLISGIWEGQDHDIPFNVGVFDGPDEASDAEEVFGPFDATEFIGAFDGHRHDRFHHGFIRAYSGGKRAFLINHSRYGYWQSPDTGIWYSAVVVTGK